MRPKIANDLHEDVRYRPHRRLRLYSSILDAQLSSRTGHFTQKRDAAPSSAKFLARGLSSGDPIESTMIGSSKFHDRSKRYLSIGNLLQLPSLATASTTDLLRFLRISPSRNRSVSSARRWMEALRLSINWELIAG